MRWVLGIVAALVLAVAAWLAIAAANGFAIPLDRLRAKYEAADSRYVTVDGVQLHVRDSGQGPVVLLIHGHFQSARIWDAWADRLDKKAVRFIRFDMPPYGLSGPDPSGRYGPERVQALLSRYIEQENLRDITIGGVSTGSAVALRYAVTHPERVQKLVLVNAPLVPVPPGMQPKAPWHMAMLEKWVFKPIFRPKFFYPYLLERLFSDPSKVTPALIQEHYDMHRKPDNARNLTTFTRNLAFTDKSYGQRTQSNGERLATVRVPTLILWGGAGTMLPVSIAESLKAAMTNTDALLIAYPNAGHFLPLEAPQAAADLQRFVLEAAPSAPVAPSTP